MFVTERFILSPFTKRAIRSMTPNFGFGGFGALVFYRTYSRLKLDGSQEHWADTVIRVIEGVMSIEKDWCVKNHLKWNEAEKQVYAREMALSFYNLEWAPPGRGIHSGGSEFVYLKGAAAHQNCGFASIKKLSEDVEWIMSMLMQGVGIGFDTYNYSSRLRLPVMQEEQFIIEDTRESWTESVRRLIESYEKGSRTLTFNYSKIRPAGSPIRGYGGTASGPEPLRLLHAQLRDVLSSYAEGEQSAVRTVVDTVNMVGSVVVAGGARRTALIALGDPYNEEFLDLKDYDKYPEREAWGWTSNNTAVMKNHEDFSRLPDIAERAVLKGEPGVLNMINMQRYGRLGEEMYDPAIGVNPCGEQPLEDKEVCCLSDVFEPRCETRERFFKAIEYATFYASVITLLPTQSEKTNAIIAKNRRIGVSISGMAEWLAREHVSSIITQLRKGYRHARAVNAHLARAHGVPESIRVTTIKPNGSTSQLAGVSPGIHLPPYGRYIRRMRVQKQSPIVAPLIEAGIPHEDDKVSMNTYVFEYPVDLGTVKGQKEATMWEKASMANMMQRHWSDNNVSVTLTFNGGTEAKDVDKMLAYNLPYTKALTVLPEGDEIYAQPPYSSCTKLEYDRRISQIRPIDWSKFEGSDGQDEMYCNSDRCEL